MEINCENRNCYNYRRFRHIVRYCRNREIESRIRKRRRLEYGNGNNRQRRMIEGRNRQNNLNGKGDLIVLD